MTRREVYTFLIGERLPFGTERGRLTGMKKDLKLHGMKRGYSFEMERCLPFWQGEMFKFLAWREVYLLAL